MSNSEFIKEYGFGNFLSICDKIKDELYILKAQKKVVGFKILNKKKKVIFYTENRLELEFARIYSMTYNNLMGVIGK